MVRAGRNRGVPLHYPFFKIAATQCNGRFIQATEWNGTEDNGRNSAGCIRVSAMKFGDEIRCVNMFGVHPLVLISFTAFVFDQVL